ncbi:MAG TPA: DUF411 domain-containing protein [Pseudomonadales bacterium]
MSIKSRIMTASTGALFLMLVVSACEKNATVGELSKPDTVVPGAAISALQVFKSPQCGCCGEWVKHMQSAGFHTQVTDTEALDAVKTRYNIPRQYQSCHTAVSEQGYIFEGHIPAKEVQRFLKEKPANAIGLSVPGMPIGSPGMEMNDKLMPYQVLLLMKDGSTQVYSHITELSR